MNMKTKYCFFIAVIMFTFPLHLLAQPTLSGNLSGTIGPGSYFVVGNCFVQSGETLVIAPGTDLLFSGYFYISVSGQLNADGTETDSIRFKRQYPTEDYIHAGIRFQSGSSSLSSISYCYIEGGMNSAYPNYYGGGIYVSGVGITISHSTITNCRASKGGGICASNAPVTITACCFEADSATSEGGGLYAIASPVTITDCIFTGNTAGNGSGLTLYNSHGASVSYCIVEDNISNNT